MIAFMNNWTTYDFKINLDLSAYGRIDEKASARLDVSLEWMWLLLDKVSV